MNIPASTYRVQFHKDFKFQDLKRILDYIERLGITTIYASPILKATPGSMHGYDTTEPHMINPEIGSLDEFRSLVAEIRRRKMTWIQDIVPNHMAFHTDNARLMDVLERGLSSPYANYFDVIWDHHAEKLKGKIQVPFLGKPLEECIASGEIKIGFSEKGFTLDYFQTSYPLSVSGWQSVFPGLELPTALDISLDRWTEWKSGWITELQSDDEKLSQLLARLDKINTNAHELSAIAQDQFYVLCYWKETEKEIGYRRFFTVNELICLCMEREEVFNEYHTFIHQLFREGLIQGVRVDHIDGLQDPATYLKWLRALFGAECYIIAEKILEAKEHIPQRWPLEGTSGYEFLSYASQLMTNRAGAKQLVSFYKELVPSLPSYKELV
ncbi:MAG TPA: alpha-amylase family glycosyl hydrolase, partial [Sphingobacteriaceae bacterium]